MIKLFKESYCENRPHFEPEVEKFTTDTIKERINTTNIYCENRHICMELIGYLSSQNK